MSAPGAARARRARSLAVVLLLVACGAPGNGDSASAPSPSTTAPAAEPLPSPGDVTTPACRPAPLEARAATVLALGIGNATSADDPLAAQVAALGVGGVILLGVNVVDEAQVRALVGGLRQRSARGLVVSLDEEGGRVSRLRAIIGTTPSARALGRRPPAEITAVAEARGTLLRELGFDLALAPVVDADGGPAGGAIGDRSFSADVAEAGALAAAFAEGLASAGVGATAKHFPGQGDLADSHAGAVVSDAPLEELTTAAATGFGPVLEVPPAAVMMSHVTFPALGPRPASLEPAAYRLLRSLGFRGVAITDAVNMSAIVDSLSDAAVTALAAGADLVLATPGDQATAMRDAVVAAVADGRLPEARLDEAVGRVLDLRGEDPSSMVCG